VQLLVSKNKGTIKMEIDAEQGKYSGNSLWRNKAADLSTED
jgi:hypothetical protein